MSRPRVPWGWFEAVLILIGAPLSVLLSLLLAIAVTLIGSTGAHAAGRVFFDGFEDGTTNAFSAYDGRNKCAAVTSSIDGVAGAHVGSYMARCNWDGNAAWDDPNSYLTMSVPSWSYSHEFLIRFWTRVDADVDQTAGSKWMRLYYRPVDTLINSFYLDGQLEYSDARALAYREFTDGQQGPQTCYTAATMRPGWHKTEVYMKDGLGGTAVNKVWIDDVEVCNETGFSSDPSNKWYPFYIMSNWSSNPGWEHDSNNHVYWDDVEIFSDTGSGGSGSLSAGTITQGGGDTTAPTGVAITVPSNGATVSGNQTVTATCTDETAVANVQMLLDGSNLGTADTSSPYSITWNTTTASNASHTLSARCTDTSSNQTTSSTISVTVNNADTIKPTGVSITTPVERVIVSGSAVTVTAVCSDETSVASVQFMLDESNIGSPDTTSPYTYSWNTTTATNAAHLLRAKCTDGAGNFRLSPAIVTYVANNADTTAPTLSDRKPIGALPYGTTSATLGLETPRENTTCKYGTTAGVAYASIANTFSTTGGKVHSQSLTGLTNGSNYTYYVRCIDGAGNATTTDYPITFSVSNTAPVTASVTITPGTPLLTIPATFYGTNIHPSTVDFEMVRPDLMTDLNPDIIRVMTNCRVDYLPSSTRFPLMPSIGTYDWTKLDALVDSVQGVGKQIYITTGFAPPNWMSGATNPCDRGPPPPTQLDDFADIMAAIAQRYTVDRSTPVCCQISVDNEPENSSYYIADYATLYRHARQKIKAVNPNLQVGGPVTGYDTWIQPGGSSVGFSAVHDAFVANGVNFDYIDYHIYTISVANVLSTIGTLQTKYPGKKVVLSELNRNWRTSGTGFDDSVDENTGWPSVAFWAEAIDEAQKLGIEQIYHFAFRENALGMFDGSFKKTRPSFFTLRAMTSFLGRNRVTTSSSNASIGAIATGSSGTHAMIYNKNPTDATVSVTLSGVSSLNISSFSKNWFESNDGEPAWGGPPWPTETTIATPFNGLVVPAYGFILLRPTP